MACLSQLGALKLLTKAVKFWKRLDMETVVKSLDVAERPIHLDPHKL